MPCPRRCALCMCVKFGRCTFFSILVGIVLGAALYATGVPGFVAGFLTLAPFALYKFLMYRNFCKQC